MAGFAGGLANKIFKIQGATRGGVPGDIMAAARRIKEGGGSNADINSIRSYLGIKQSGATFARSQLKQVQQAGQTITKFAVLSDVASRGGTAGAAATFGMVQLAAKQFEKFAQTKAFENIIAKTVQKPAVIKALKPKFGIADRDYTLTQYNPTPANEAAEAEAKSGNAERLATIAGRTYALRRFARMAGAVAAYGQAGYLATKFSVGLGESLGGLAGGESLRMARSEANIAGADSSLSREQRELAGITAQKEEYKATGTIGNLLKGRIFQTGALAEREADLTIKAAMQQAGFGGDLDAIKSKARERVLRDKYGFLGGALAEKRDDVYKSLGISSAEWEEEIGKNAAQSISRVSQLRKAAYEAADRRDVLLSRALFQEANKEIPGSVSVWENPESRWKSQQIDRGAVRTWPSLNMTRAGERKRTGD